MCTDPTLPPVDVGLLSPATVRSDSVVADAAIVAALVIAEVALVRAFAAVGALEQTTATAISEEFGWPQSSDARIDARMLAEDAVAGGNPVIPLVRVLRARVAEPARSWIHRGATSQDILDTALMLVATRAAERVLADLRRAEQELVAFAEAHRDLVTAARTLTQQAVPTTVGARAAGWVRSIRRAIHRLDDVRSGLPAQLGGAAGTLAAFVDDLGDARAIALPAAYAAELGLQAPTAPWHTHRWPVTELGDALTQATDALGMFAGDVATLARTEIGELSAAEAGGSSTMPHKANPVGVVLIRSAALRAPHLNATLHVASALAVDERPDGAWHAEWPTLRELLRVALGASAHAARLAGALRVDEEAVKRNLALTGGLIVSERLERTLVPLIGRERFAALLARAVDGGLAALVLELPDAPGLDVDGLLDPAGYTGLAGHLVDGLLDGPAGDA